MGRVKIGVGIWIGLLSGVCLAPSVAGAQGTSAASVIGVVKDASGGILPGVTVEVASPSLTEKVRTTVTDEQGQYRITELRPGTYRVTFSLTGFSALQRAGIELPPNFTATVNAELKVGELSETITVSGATPLVDVSSVTQERVFSKTILDAVPTSKSMLAIAALMPAAVTPIFSQDVGGSKGETSVKISVHGGKPFDGSQQQEGMTYNGTYNEGGSRAIIINPLFISEVVVDTGTAGSAQYGGGGAAVNVIPKDGGNKFSATFFGAWTDHNLQSNNFTDALRQRGVTSVNQVQKIFDANVAGGGPIIKDKLWFFATTRRNGSSIRVQNLYRDSFARPYHYTPDSSRPVDALELNRPLDSRVTWQKGKDKFAFSYTFQRNQRDNQASQLDQGTLAAEANAPACLSADFFQGVWTRPQTSKLLFEGGLTIVRSGSSGGNWGTDICLSDFQNCGVSFYPDRVQITDVGLGFTYNGVGNRAKAQTDQMNGRSSVSYITGAHHWKAGVDFLMTTKPTQAYFTRNPVDAGGLPVTYTFRNGTPISLTEFVDPNFDQQMVRPRLGLFLQDQWNIKRLTVSLGLRYDYIREYTPAFHRDAGLVNGAADFPALYCIPCWHDLSPRMGVAYDLFGDGKTAVKFGLNRYVEALTVGLAQTFGPQAASIDNTSRAWTDSIRNFIPDCDLRNPAANGECGPMANQAFGQAQIHNTPDPNWINGWGNRAYNWQM